MSIPARQRFNLALRPVNAAVNSAFTSAAALYAGTAEGYLLGYEALPHVTLCQFYAPDTVAAREAFASWPDKKSLPLVLGKIWSKPGKNEHAGTWWPEIEVVHAPELLALQKSLYDHLAKLGFEVLTTPENYRPHFTLARCGQALEEPLIQPASLSVGQTIDCETDIGTCSENGVFIRSIASPPRNFTK